jgi:hypothetical protein
VSRPHQSSPSLPTPPLCDGRRFANCRSSSGRRGYFRRKEGVPSESSSPVLPFLADAASVRWATLRQLPLLSCGDGVRFRRPRCSSSRLPLLKREEGLLPLEGGGAE